MESCTHKNLVLLSAPADRVRCLHCHLTIARDELPDRYCPECYETTGRKRFDFEPVADQPARQVQYRCEDCGLLIRVD